MSKVQTHKAQQVVSVALPAYALEGLVRELNGLLPGAQNILDVSHELMAAAATRGGTLPCIRRHDNYNGLHVTLRVVQDMRS